MSDRRAIQVPELLEQILDQHFYEAATLLTLLLTVVVLRVFCNLPAVRKTINMPAASPATVHPASSCYLYHKNILINDCR